LELICFLKNLVLNHQPGNPVSRAIPDPSFFTWF
jgi:hypothetical protein